MRPHPRSDHAADAIG